MDKTEQGYFAQAVYDIVRLVPAGRATSYGAIARAAGHPGHSRLVGRIMAVCDSAASGIPAHRVVNSQGVLSAAAAFGAPGRMRQLLEAEGVEVAGERIRRWKQVFWDPMEEL